jgi:hypothetical protein
MDADIRSALTMPESNRKWPPHPHVAAQEQTMSKAKDIGQLVKITCTWCRLSRRYRAGDMLLVCGDVAIFDIPGRFRCEKCKRKDYMDAIFELPSAREMVGMTIRKLVRIKTIQRPVWEDVTL